MSRGEYARPPHDCAGEVVDFVTAGGVQVVVPVEEWCDLLGDALDGGGVVRLLPPLAPGADEVTILIALPLEAHPEQAMRDLRFELAMFRDGRTAAVAIALGVDTPAGEAVNLTCLDLGLGSNRVGLAQFAEQPLTNIIRVHPTTGRVLGQRLYELGSARRELARVLTTARGCRPMTSSEFDEAFRAIHRKLAALPVQMASPPAPGRNQPCPCGSGVKFKRCCGGGPASTSGAARSPHRASTSSSGTASVLRRGNLGCAS